MYKVKIKIKDREHCIQVQNHLFNLGKSWAGVTKIKYEHASWLFLYKNLIFYCSNEEFGQKHNYKEITIDFEPEYEIY